MSHESRDAAARALASVNCREAERGGRPCYQCVDVAFRILAAAGMERESERAPVEPVVSSLITIRCKNMGDHVLTEVEEWEPINKPLCDDCYSIVSISIPIPGQPNQRHNL